jgi:methylase of polypeptide subunit release factors
VTPTLDIAAARKLGDALRRVGYKEDSIEELLGEDAWSTALEDVPAHERRLGRSPVATTVRLFFLELPVARPDAERALGRRGVEALARTGLAGVGESVSPLVRIAPVGALLLASDRLSTNPAEDPPDYVSTYTPTARLCDLLTPRPQVSAALDVGTGNGVHALLAAAHSEHVVATDVNPRALAFTELNAALSGITNVECRRGSLFEPVAGERFELITCNPPYVVSPERRWTYRDTWLDGDELSALVTRQTAAHLAEDGLATMLVSWLAPDREAPDEHVVDWLDGSGCDAWILPVDESSPLEHAERWNAHLAGDGAAYGEALDRWTAYLDELAVGVVTEGAVLLHRRPGRNTIRIDEVDEDELEPADSQIRRAFAARAQLDGRDLLDARLAPADALRVETQLRRGRVCEARVTLEDGTRPELDVSAATADLVGALDGRRTLRELSASRDAVAACRELLELGALELRGFTSAPSGRARS